jgi:hypothetical protein
MTNVMAVGYQWPRSAIRAICSPAPKKRYQSGPPKMQPMCSSDAATDIQPLAISHALPGLADILDLITAIRYNDCVERFKHGSRAQISRPKQRPHEAINMRPHHCVFDMIIA